MWRNVVISVGFLLLISVAKAGIVLGNPNGSVTLTEVMDYQCAHCVRMQPAIDWLIAHNPKLKVEVVPVSLINQRSLIEAASALVLARHQGKVAAFHHQLMANARNPLPVVRAVMRSHPDWVREMHQAWVKHQLDRGLALLKQAHSGTPLFIISRTDQPKRPRVLRGEVSLPVLIKTLHEVSA